MALAHAKSGDAAALAGYVGKRAKLDEAIVEFAFVYADQTEKDHIALTAAANGGRIAVAIRNHEIEFPETQSEFNR